MTLNCIVAVILRYFTEFGSFRANYVKQFEVIPILSQNVVGKYIIYGNILRNY